MKLKKNENLVLINEYWLTELNYVPREHKRASFSSLKFHVILVEKGQKNGKLEETEESKSYP